MLISEPMSISQMSAEELKNIKLLIFCLTSLQYCYFLSHFYAVIKTSENEKMTDVFKLFRRYDRNVSAKKNGTAQRLWIGHGRTRSACHASGRKPIRSIGSVSRKRSSKTWFIVCVMIMNFEIQITHLCGESLFVRGGVGGVVFTSPLGAWRAAQSILNRTEYAIKQFNT